MKSRTLFINDVHVESEPVEYRCYGLGSCVALFIIDRLNMLSAGAHIALLSGEGSDGYPDAPAMLDSLLNELQRRGSDLKSLRAKIAGGAKVIEGSENVGEQNIRSVLQYLIQRRIFIAGSDLGGRVCRTATFNSVTGQLGIRTSGQENYFI